MDVYHKILVKLYDVTGGKQSKTVDFIDLVKEEGFYPSYKDIFRQMSQAGWISEAGRSDVVKITHWGVKEAKKSKSGTPDTARALRKQANALHANVKEFSVVTEEFLSDIDADNFKLVEKKFSKIKNAIEKLKADL